MKGARFSIAPTILIDSIDHNAGAKHEVAGALVDALADRDCVLRLQAFAEFFHAVTRKHKMPTEDAAAMVQDWMVPFPVAAAVSRALRGVPCA